MLNGMIFRHSQSNNCQATIVAFSRRWRRGHCHTESIVSNNCTATQSLRANFKVIISWILHCESTLDSDIRPSDAMHMVWQFTATVSQSFILHVSVDVSTSVQYECNKTYTAAMLQQPHQMAENATIKVNRGLCWNRLLQAAGSNNIFRANTWLDKITCRYRM